MATFYRNDGNAGSNSSGTGNGTYDAENEDIWYNLRFSELSKLVNADGRYECPRRNCYKNYKDASSLQRHIRYDKRLFHGVICTNNVYYF